MGKIKIILLIVVMYFIYQGMSKIMDSSLDIAKKGQEIEESGEFERTEHSPNVCFWQFLRRFRDDDLRHREILFSNY